MITLSKPAKLLVFGSVALLLLAILAFTFLRPPERNPTAASHPVRPSSDEWTCQWLDGPTIIHDGAEHTQCRGVVHCRHQTMRTFVPQVRQIRCATTGDNCEPSACFTNSMRTR